MSGFVSTLATIWRLAIPYFRSEDRVAGQDLPERRERPRFGPAGRDAGRPDLLEGAVEGAAREDEVGGLAHEGGLRRLDLQRPAALERGRAVVFVTGYFDRTVTRSRMAPGCGESSGLWLTRVAVAPSRR